MWWGGVGTTGTIQHPNALLYSSFQLLVVDERLYAPFKINRLHLGRSLPDLISVHSSQPYQSDKSKRDLAQLLQQPLGVSLPGDIHTSII